ncbi:MAG: hypothetical protein JXB49_24490 [Bacteroidales bacterium]|nr:hypothetical protein [Bacteroidales bacterium]
MIINLSNRRRLVFVFLITVVLSFSTDIYAAKSEPDNAALLYYQALLVGPDFDYMLIDNALREAEPNEAVRKYIQSCDEKINLAESAAKISQCDWGVLNTQRVYMLGDLNRLSRLISVKAIILALDGKYKEALEKCIAIQRIANHVNNYNTSPAHSISIDIISLSFMRIQRILGLMPPDEEILTWLQAQLSMQNKEISFLEVIKDHLNPANELIEIDPEPIEIWKLQVAIFLGLPYDEKQATGINPAIIEDLEDFHEMKKMEDLSDEELKNAMQERVGGRIDDEDIKEFRDMFDYTDETKKEVQELLTKPEEEIIEQARRSCDRFLYSFIRIIENEIPYQQRVSKLEEITNQTFNNIYDPLDILDNIFLPSLSGFLSEYEYWIRYKAYLNIMKSALEIYLVKAQTGELPKKLPEYLPKDPLCDQNFIYEITSEGFALKSSVDMNTKNNIHLEFKVANK